MKDISYFAPVVSLLVVGTLLQPITDGCNSFFDGLVFFFQIVRRGFAILILSGLWENAYSDHLCSFYSAALKKRVFELIFRVGRQLFYFVPYLCQWLSVIAV
jgi:hypothetical protein